MARILITGCSTGIGRAAAVELTKRGHDVVATARRPETLADLDVAQTLALDVDDDASVAAAVGAAGTIDVLVNNAGFGVIGPVERLPIAEGKRIFETNFFGALRMIQAVLPAMRERGSGTIVNVTSLAGRVAPPLDGIYSATKFALEGLSEALHYEVGHFGVRVRIVEPGCLRDRLLREHRALRPRRRAVRRARPAVGVGPCEADRRRRRAGPRGGRDRDRRRGRVRRAPVCGGRSATTPTSSSPPACRWTTRRSSRRCETRSGSSGERRATAMTLVTDTPASVLAVYAHPDDPEISAGGTLARWAEAGASVWLLITTRGDKGTSDPDVDLDALAELRVEETGKAAALLGLAGHFHLATGDGELEDDARLRGDIVRLVRELRPEVVLCPDPTAVFFGDELLQPPRPPCDRLGDARRGRARRRQPALLPRAPAGGPRRPPGRRGLPVRARSSPTAGSTSARPSNARSTRCSATPASSPRPATGSASSSAPAPRTPAGPRA